MTNPSVQAHSRLRLCVATLALALCAMARPAAACAVCFGNPESPLTKGVGAGVLFLVGVISTLLLGVASVATFWAVRARRLARAPRHSAPHDGR